MVCEGETPPPKSPSLAKIPPPLPNHPINPCSINFVPPPPFKCPLLALNLIPLHPSNHYRSSDSRREEKSGGGVGCAITLLPLVFSSLGERWGAVIKSCKLQFVSANSCAQIRGREHSLHLFPAFYSSLLLSLLMSATHKAVSLATHGCH